jgi:L-fuculose-phosphate aldolase
MLFDRLRFVSPFVHSARMILQDEREVLAEAGREVLGAGLTVATGGNLSVCDRKKGLIAITPSGMDYKKLKAADICVLDMQGRQVDGRRVPSSETPMHLCILRARAEFNAIVHTHPPYCTAFSILREAIPAIHYLIPLMGNDIPVAEYATYGTEAMGPAALRAMESSTAVLLPNHGLIVAGATLDYAVSVSNIAEYIAQAYSIARSIGKPHVLPDEELDNIREQLKRYGQVKNGKAKERAANGKSNGKRRKQLAAAGR